MILKHVKNCYAKSGVCIFQSISSPALTIFSQFMTYPTINYINWQMIFSIMNSNRMSDHCRYNVDSRDQVIIIYFETFVLSIILFLHICILDVLHLNFHTVGQCDNFSLYCFIEFLTNQYHVCLFCWSARPWGAWCCKFTRTWRIHKSEKHSKNWTWKIWDWYMVFLPFSERV